MDVTPVSWTSGCWASSRTSSCPAYPVAPNTAVFIFVIARLLFWRKRKDPEAWLEVSLALVAPIKAAPSRAPSDNCYGGVVCWCMWRRSLRLTFPSMSDGGNRHSQGNILSEDWQPGTLCEEKFTNRPPSWDNRSNYEITHTPMPVSGDCTAALAIYASRDGTARLCG